MTAVDTAAKKVAPRLKQRYVSEIAAAMREEFGHKNPMEVPTLTKMGEVTSDLAAFKNLPDTVDMRIERR